MANTLFFHLTLLNGEYVSDEILDALEDVNPEEFFKDENLTELQQGGYESRWDTHSEDLLELSKRFPDEVFVLNSEGERLYKDYFKNGKTQSTIGEITFPEYDENNLV